MTIHVALEHRTCYEFGKTELIDAGTADWDGERSR
jgi:hypothetical protein